MKKRCKDRNLVYYQLKYLPEKSLDRMLNDDVAELFRALNRYKGGAREELESDMADLIYQQMCDVIDDDHKSFSTSIEDKKKAAEARWNKDKQNNAEQSNGMQCITTESNGMPTPTPTPTPTQAPTQAPTPTPGDKSPSSYRGEEEVCTADSFVSQCCSDRQWLEVIAMKTHLPIGKVIEKLKDADMTMIADGDYPKSINEYKARAHRIITNVKKEDNGNGKQRVRAADLL